MNIRRLGQQDYDDVLLIAESLPEWFTPKGLETLRKDLQVHGGFVVVAEKSIRGFLSFFVEDDKLTISWMGVAPAYHRRGYGKMLIKSLKEFAATQGIQSILVSTLGDS